MPSDSNAPVTVITSSTALTDNGGAIRRDYLLAYQDLKRNADPIIVRILYVQCVSKCKQ